MARSTVDLPEPDSPTRPKDSPGCDVEADVLQRVMKPSIDDATSFSIGRALRVMRAHSGSRFEHRQRMPVRRRSSAGSSAGRAYRDAAALRSSRRLQLLDDLAGIHDDDAVAEGRDQPQIVGDEDQPHAALGDQLVEDAQHLELHRDVERRGRLVGDQQVRARRSASWRSSRAGPCRPRPRADRGRRRARDRGSAPPPAWRAPGRAPRALPTLLMRAQRLDDLAADASSPGSSENFGSCRIMAMRLPRSCAALARRGRQQVDAVELQPLGRHLRLAAASGPGWRGRSATCRSRIRRRCRAARGRARRRRRAPPRSTPVRVGKRTRRSSTSRSGASLIALLRVEHVAQAVAEQVEAEADDEDRDAGHRRDPPLVEDEAAAGRRSSRPIRAAAAARRGRGSRGRRRSG